MFRMAFLISLLMGTQILCSLARSPPHPGPPPPRPPAGTTSLPCNSSSVKETAELVLDKINEDRKEGYVLGLQRIFDVHQGPWVFGQCHVNWAINKQSSIQVLTYNCFLYPLPASAITRFCPDCPVPGDLTQSRFLEAAALSLAKFNMENNHAHFFNVRNVTRARSQWVIGPAVFVEYVIQETSCSKSQPVADLSECPFLPYETADVGVCRGSVVDSKTDNEKHVSARCEIFHRQPRVGEGQQAGDRKPGHQDDERPEGDGQSESQKGGHLDRQHQRHHPRDHRHRNHSQDHAEHEQGPPTDGGFKVENIVGVVKVLPSFLPETEAEQLDGLPVSPESQEPDPNQPDGHSAPEGSRPLGKPGLTKPARPAPHSPFPGGFPESDTCPGEILAFVLGVEPFLPKRPVEVSPTGPQAKENIDGPIPLRLTIQSVQEKQD